MGEQQRHTEGRGCSIRPWIWQVYLSGNGIPNKKRKAGCASGAVCIAGGYVERNNG